MTFKDQPAASETPRPETPQNTVVNQPNDKDVSTSTGIHSINDAWVHSLDPIALMRDANESSNRWLPFGIGFDIDHPQALASPESLELSVLDPLFRGGKAAWDMLIKAPFNSLRDDGSAVKDAISVVKDAVDFPVDVLSLHASDSIDDVKNIGIDGLDSLKHLAEAAIVDPVIGIGNAIKDIL
jgi:hypothetical protein